MKNTHDRNRRQILGILVNILTVVSLLCCIAIWAIPHNVAGVALKLLLMVSVWMPPLACKKINERLDVLCRIENARLRCGSEPIVNRRVNVCPQPSVKVAPRYISTPKVVTPTRSIATLESPVQPSRAVSTQTYAEIQVQPILALLREASNSSNKIIAQKEQKNAYKIAQASTPLSTSGSPDQVAANLKAEPIQKDAQVQPLITQDIGATIARPSSEQDDTTAHEILIVATNDQLESEDITPIFVPVTGISLACEFIEAEPTQLPQEMQESRSAPPAVQLQSVNMEVQPFVPDHGSKAEDLIPDEIPAPVNPSCSRETLINLVCTLPDEAARPIKEKINISEVSRTQLLSEAQLADTVKESKPTTIIQALKLVEATGEFVTVTYAYGSRPGQERDLAVLCLINNNQAIRVIESGEHEEKTYVINRIMEVQLQDGSKFYNTENIERFRAWKQENDAYQSRRRDLINICSFGTNAKLKECRFEVSRTIGGYWILNKETFKSTTIQATDIESARRGAYALELMLSESEGYWWDLQHILVSNRVYWPDWMNLQRKANQDGQRIAHEYESESNGQVWLDVPFRERCIHYEQSTFWGEEDSQYLEWGMIFEAVEMDMPNTLNHMNVLGIDRTEFMEYILGSNRSRRPLKLPNGHISAKTLEKLISLGLAITTADRTAMEILGSCTVTELKSIVKPFGLKLTGIKKSDLVAICLKTMPPEKILDLMERKKKYDQYWLNAPSGLSWEQFQNFKACYRKMMSMLLHYLDKNLNCKESVQKLLE